MSFRIKGKSVTRNGITVVGEGITVICVEPDGVCELCGKVAELRPYGANGENICYECGEKDPKETEKMMRKILFGD